MAAMLNNKFVTRGREERSARLSSAPRLLERSRAMIELDQAVSADLGGCVCAARQCDRQSACHERAFGDPDPTPIFAGSKAAHALVVAEQLQSSNQVYQRALDKFGFIEAWAKPNAERRTPNAPARYRILKNFAIQ